jgi:hypothetical protein
MAADARAQRVLSVIDLRPVVWEATMVTAASDVDVTVVVKVTYRSLIEICDETFGVTDSAFARYN